MATQTLEIGDSAARAQAALASHPEPTSDALGEKLILNMGPSHPATHGVLRLVLELDGEIITKVTPDIGYLHRGDEKIAENMQYNQFVPYTDRLDYLAPLANNVAYALAVEKLMGWELPPRGKAIRVICCEMARISAHLLGIGSFAMDTGAMTVFLYTFTEREKLYNLIELLTGARFTTSYTRIGGQTHDLPDGLRREAARRSADEFPAQIDEIDNLLTRNPIFINRTKDIAVISREKAIAYALSGPNLRGSRRRARRAQGASVSRLRPVRLRHPGRHGGRLLRSLPRAHARDAREREDSQPGAGPAARRARSTSTNRKGLPAAEGNGAQEDGGADPSIHARDRGHQGAAGRDLFRRGKSRRANSAFTFTARAAACRTA